MSRTQKHSQEPKPRPRQIKRQRQEMFRQQPSRPMFPEPDPAPWKPLG